MGIERGKEVMKKIERPIYGDNEGWREREIERYVQRQKEIGGDGERIYEIYNIYTIRDRI